MNTNNHTISPPPPHKWVRAVVISSSIFALVAGAQAVTTWTADFTGMSTEANAYNNPSGAEANIISKNEVGTAPGGSDFTWQSLNLAYGSDHSVSYRSSLSIVENNGNPALHVSPSSTLAGDTAKDSPFKGVSANLPTIATFVNEGDFLSISFTGQFVSDPINSGSALRLGFAMNDSVNFDLLFTQLGTGETSGLINHWSANNRLATYNSTDAPPGGSVAAKTDSKNDQYLGTDPFTISFSIELIDVDSRIYQLTTTVDSSSENSLDTRRVTGTVAESDVVVKGVTYSRDFSTFDSFFIRSQSDTAPFTLDDVVVTYVPEPSVPLMLGSLLCGTLFYRRRV